MKLNIYVATSWRNEIQPHIVELLKASGHDVYDFRHPEPGSDGFHWRSVDDDWQQWDRQQYKAALESTEARQGFLADKSALDKCNVCLLVLPCGTSAHLELGYALGKGKTGIIYYPPGVRVEPELMYKFADSIVLDEYELIRRIRHEQER